jgi:hypothetical protein
MKKITLVLIIALFVSSLITNLGVGRLSNEEFNLTFELLGLTIVVWICMFLYKCAKYITKKLINEKNLAMAKR